MGFSGSAPAKPPETVAAPAAAPAPVAANKNDNVIAAVIAAAIAACDGGEELACVNRMSACSGWTNYARIEGVTIRNQMF